MRKRAHNQKGFTLVEVLIVVAILGMLTPVIAGSIIQIIRGTDRNNAKIIALADIDHAASWLNQDLLMAQTILKNGEPMAFGNPADLVAGDNLTIGWTDYYGGNATAHQSLYYIIDETRLMRKYGYDNQTANIASYISRAEFSIDGSGELVTVTLASFPESVLGRSETKTYRIYRRSRGE